MDIMSRMHRETLRSRMSKRIVSVGARIPLSGLRQSEIPKTPDPDKPNAVINCFPALHMHEWRCEICYDSKAPFVQGRAMGFTPHGLRNAEEWLRDHFDENHLGVSIILGVVGGQEDR